MATINLTASNTNQQKRFAEAVVMTIAAQLDEGGQRLATPPTYIQGGDAVTASIVEADTVIKRAYLIVDEAFPAGTEINVDIAGTQYFVTADGTATGLLVSTSEDNLLKNGQTITVSFTGVTGDITTGVCRVVLDTVSLSLRNGNYAEA